MFREVNTQNKPIVAEHLFLKKLDKIFFKYEF